MNNLGKAAPMHDVGKIGVPDAVSAKRCYIDAMPLSECYKIIENGRGEDFDPDIVDAFMMDRDKVEEIYNSVKFIDV